MVKYVEGQAAHYGRLGGEGHCDEDLGGGDGKWAIGDDEADDNGYAGGGVGDDRDDDDVR